MRLIYQGGVPHLSFFWLGHSSFAQVNDGLNPPELTFDFRPERLSEGQGLTLWKLVPGTFKHKNGSQSWKARIGGSLAQHRSCPISSAFAFFFFPPNRCTWLDRVCHDQFIGTLMPCRRTFLCCRNQVCPIRKFGLRAITIAETFHLLPES